MTITLDSVRDRLRVDDFSYNNDQLTALMDEAKAALKAETGIAVSDVVVGSNLDLLTDSYIVEYCRNGFFESADTTAALAALAVKCEAVRDDE